MTNRQKTLDMTEGTIWWTLLAFFLPILLGSLLQQLYTTADAIIVGRLAGKQGLAAIDSVYTLLRLPVNFFTGMATGATILISQLYGAKRREELDRAVHTAVAFSAVGGLILSAAGVLAAPRCLGLMGVPAELREMTLSYMRIYFAGFVISMVYNVGAGILRAIGDSETPFRVLAVSCVVNILLDLLLVGPVGWGVAGAALATVLAQGVSALLVLGALARPAGGASVLSLPHCQHDHSGQHQRHRHRQHCRLGLVRKAGSSHLAGGRLSGGGPVHLCGPELRRPAVRTGPAGGADHPLDDPRSGGRDQPGAVFRL